MIIRKAKKEDLSECFELLKTKEILDADKKPCRHWWIKSFLKQIFWVAEEDKKIIGFIIGELDSGNVALIHIIVVKKEFRRKGIGTLLLIKAEKEFKRKKAKAILLYGYAKKRQEKFFKKFKYAKGAKTYEFLKFI